MKVLIVYKSFLGSTKEYAEWLSQMVDGSAQRWKDVKDSDLENSDVVVVSSGTYAGWMPLSRYLKKKWNLLRDKRVVVVAVGAAPAEAEWSVRSYDRIPKDIRESIEYFKIPGKAGDDSSNVKKENLNPIVSYINDLKKDSK